LIGWSVGWVVGKAIGGFNLYFDASGHSSASFRALDLFVAGKATASSSGEKFGGFMERSVGASVDWHDGGVVGWLVGTLIGTFVGRNVGWFVRKRFVVSLIRRRFRWLVGRLVGS
jgi:hypothetical protein